jgi:hypothetical protein
VFEGIYGKTHTSLKVLVKPDGTFTKGEGVKKENVYWNVKIIDHEIDGEHRYICYPKFGHAGCVEISSNDFVKYKEKFYIRLDIYLNISTSVESQWDRNDDIIYLEKIFK